MQTIDKIKNFIQIDNHLATAGQPSKRELEKLADAGYQVVVNLGLDDAYYAIENESVWVEQLGMRYIHIPVDFKKPRKEDFVHFLNTMNIEQNKKVLVHCAENKRVSVFVALYRVITKKLPQIDGWNSIIDVWEPDIVWESFFYQVLDSFYKIKDQSPVL
ncbi:MAG: protein tyrosine phosphatase family protein [Thioalkalispiraceae bacterium]